MSTAIGPERACSVYEKLLRRTLGVAADFKLRNPDARILLFHTPGDPLDAILLRFSGPWEFHEQSGDHLGIRMENAVNFALSTGASQAVLIGSDLAELSVNDLEDAFRRTAPGTAALGPASDGGFYLIGLSRPCSAPFRYEEWGTPDACLRTRHALTASGLAVQTLTTRSDVDRPEDVALLDTDPVMGTSLSIVIPTLGGSEALPRLLGFLDAQLWPGDEIIVVRGSNFGKIEVSALSPRVRYVRSPKGRGLQQNAGAMLAQGDLFFFLHDDTFPPPGFPFLIRQACAHTDTALGCFRLSFRPAGRFVDLIARWANVRTAAFKLPYGDQGFFCRRDVFERAGGFRLNYIMEDVDLVRRCKKLGKQVMLPFPVGTSPERYLRKGVFRASLQNHATMLLFSLGVDEKALYDIYYRRKPYSP